MPANSYRFEEFWTLPGASPAEVWQVIADARLLPEWWRGVYLSVEPLDSRAGPPRVGDRVRARARGFLPYTLDFLLEATDLVPGQVAEVTAHGDFEGVWRAVLSPTGDGTRVDITWTVRVQKPIVRFFSPLLKPVFRWNHNWTTPRGEAGLRAYLAEHKTGPEPAA